MSVERQNLTIETEFHSDSRETWLFLSMSRPNLEYGEHVLTIETELYSDSRETWPLLSMSRPNLKCGGHVSSRGKQNNSLKCQGEKSRI